MKSSFARIDAAGRAIKKNSNASEKINLLWHKIAMYSHQMQFAAHKQGRNRINYHIENCRFFSHSQFCCSGHTHSPFSLSRTLSKSPTQSCAFESLFGQEIFVLSNRAHQLIQVRCCANKYTIYVYAKVNTCYVAHIHGQHMHGNAAIKMAHGNKRANRLNNVTNSKKCVKRHHQGCKNILSICTNDLLALREYINRSRRRNKTKQILLSTNLRRSAVQFELVSKCYRQKI